MTSLTNSAVAAPKVASVNSINYLCTLLEERTDEQINDHQFLGMTQEAVSDLIEVALTTACLPASLEQLAEVSRLATLLKRGTLVTKDRGQASRQIRAMRSDLTAISNSRRVLTDDRRESATELLDTLMGAVTPAAPVEVSANEQDGLDDLPF